MTKFKLKLLTGIIIISSIFIYPAKILASPTDPYMVHLAINQAFCGAKHRSCGLGEKAKRVAQCESTWRAGVSYLGVFAKSGEYLGLFQMGRGERSFYGFAFSPFAQATAARKMYNNRGWYPWPKCGRL